MAEARAQWASVTSAEKHGSDTDADTEGLVFAADLPDEELVSTPDSSVRPRAEKDLDAPAEGPTKSTAELKAEIDSKRAHLDEVVDELEARVEEKVETVQETVQQAKRVLDPRRLLKEHPIAVAAIGLGVIGLGFIAYRFVRKSFPVRAYLAFRFGRFSELYRP